MTSYVALLRAVNVGGTGTLPMAKLRALCSDAGFGDVRTYIASGNVVFTADDDETAVCSALEQRLAAYAGKPVGVFVRDAAQLRAVLDANPFPGEPGNRVTATFLAAAPPPHALDDARRVVDERLALGTREIYIHYPSGMGRSQLKLPAAASGTARNLNTVARLTAMPEENG